MNLLFMRTSLLLFPVSSKITAGVPGPMHLLCVVPNVVRIVVLWLRTTPPGALLGIRLVSL